MNMPRWMGFAAVACGLLLAACSSDPKKETVSNEPAELTSFEEEVELDLVAFTSG